MWRVLSTKLLFKHPRITLVEDVVELPNGDKTDYLRFENQGDAVTVLCRDEGGRFLLQKEYSHPVKSILWQFPGGKIEGDEDTKEAANRELQEESHLKAEKITILGKYLLNNRRSDAVMHVVLAEDFVEASLPPDAEEQIESHWLTQAQIDDLISAGEIQNVHVLAALQLYKQGGVSTLPSHT